MKKVVLHYLNGKILKGTTFDFSPERSWFHLTQSATGETIKVDSSLLKGIFFVKTFEGNPLIRKNYDLSLPGLGTKMMVCFKDGERVFGHTYGVGPERKGFFLFLSDRYKIMKRSLFSLRRRKTYSFITEKSTTAFHSE